MRTHRFLHFIRNSVEDVPGGLALDGSFQGTGTFAATLEFEPSGVLPDAFFQGQGQFVAELLNVETVELPCPSFPVLRVEEPPLRQSTGGVIVVERDEGIDRRDVVLVYTGISLADVEKIEAAWGDGTGLVRPFYFTVPEETVPRRFVMESPPRIERRTASDSTARVTLRDVSRGVDDVPL